MKYLKALFQKKSQISKTDITRRFELIARVGQGSMSKVWRARDSLSGQIVALKVLDKVKTLKLESRFVGLKKPHEGEIAIQLNHPHIVKTHEFGLTFDDEMFLVMDFIDGVGLSFLVEMQNAVMQQHRVQFLIQLGEAIEYFHRQNWIHRDICPRNVLVDDTHNIKLIDFGLVVPNTPAFRRPGNRTGTANYMAPELIKRHQTDQRIDIFSYAVTCFEMYAKQLPWDAAQSFDAAMQHINQPPKDLREFAPDIDAEISETIMRGLKTYPDDRWSTVGEMLEHFRNAFERVPQPAVAEAVVDSRRDDSAIPGGDAFDKAFQDEFWFSPQDEQPVTHDTPTHRKKRSRRDKRGDKHRSNRSPTRKDPPESDQAES